ARLAQERGSIVRELCEQCDAVLDLDCGLERLVADGGDRPERVELLALARDPEALAHLAEDFFVTRRRLDLRIAGHRPGEPDRAGVIQLGNSGEIPGDLAGGLLLELGETRNQLLLVLLQATEGPGAARPHAHRRG